MSIAEELVDVLRCKGLRLAVAESCTGGKLAAAVTDVAGASEVFDCGVVSYSNGIKHEVLCVPAEQLALYGAVSPQVAEAMARGVRELAHADLALSTTGIAGPGGGSAEKPVGLVYIGFADADRVFSVENRFSGDRRQVREQTVARALELLKDNLAEKGLI